MFHCDSLLQLIWEKSMKFIIISETFFTKVRLSPSVSIFRLSVLLTVNCFDSQRNSYVFTLSFLSSWFKHFCCEFLWLPFWNRFARLRCSTQAGPQESTADLWFRQDPSHHPELGGLNQRRLFPLYMYVCLLIWNYECIFMSFKFVLMCTANFSSWWFRKQSVYFFAKESRFILAIINHNKFKMGFFF